ncbi:DUF4202 domain-containing protein [Flavicella sediminum]|uniref:DUF4202 domain-containing protein n=1 Tax=Flavicella sediminum TaxID=2585141 RepID=UPI001121691E|nr:DUF4202 domain-containing protein [Flavicella sediminum]
MKSEKFSKAIALFDQANSEDPTIEVFEGKEFPKEILYAQRMTQVLSQFAPNASEAVQLAARCQHICRWKSPRSSYEMNRTGYLLWRQELKKMHAKIASEILKEVGYDEDTIAKVAFLLEKKQLKRNEETQLLEDVICLVFLEFYFDPFVVKYTEEKILDIVQKTWKKMSETGHETALKIPFSKDSLAVIMKALS